jgi:hypothetical protein
MDLRSFQSITNAWQHGGQVGKLPQTQQFQNKNVLAGEQAQPSGSIQIDQNKSIIQQVLQAATAAGIIQIPPTANLGDMATVISSWFPTLNAPPNNLGWPSAPADFLMYVTELLKQPGTPVPNLQGVADAARRYIDAFGAIPYMPWDKIPWQWLKDGGAVKVADAFKNNPGAIADGFKLLAQIALIPANVPWQSGGKANDALQSLGKGIYAPPNILTIDWTADPYKSVLDWFKKASDAVTSGQDYWPLLYWMVTTPEAIAHVDHLPMMYQDLKCYTDKAYGDGVQNFKDQIVKDTYVSGWCAKKAEPGDGKTCAATGQTCDSTHLCCEGLECKEGKCAEKSSNTIWWVLGGLGVVALAGVGIVMASGGAKANPCGCEQRNPRRGGRIAQITDAEIRTYSDSGQVKAYVSWVDAKGERGRTEGDPDGPHMLALLDRARREGVPVHYETW